MTHKVNSMEDLGESWVELGVRANSPHVGKVSEEYLRLLREAQRESANSSARQSLASSRRDSPKSPPNSPNTEPSTEDELRGVYINFGNKEGELRSAEWVCQYSSRPDQLPPKDWRFRHPGLRRASLSLRRARLGGRPLFGRDLLASLLLSNLLSLLVGAGIGVWLSRRSTVLSSVALQ